MNRELLLHIGMPKCASTYLQKVLLNNQGALSQGGIAYPHDRAQLHPGNGSGFAEADETQLETAFGESQRLILSHEDLFAQAGKAASLAKATRRMGVRVHIFAFIRPFSEFVFGDYSQNMKQKFDEYMRLRQPYAGRSFQTFTVLRSNSLKPAQRFQNWITALTDESGSKPQFTLASYSKIQETMTPYLNGASLDWSLPLHEGNPSLRMEDCDRLAAMIRDTSVSSAAVSRAREEAMRQAGTSDAGKTPDRIAWIEAIFEKQNADLDEMFNYNNRKMQDVV